MSRIGKTIINIPQGVDVKIDGVEILVKGPKGELKMVVDSNMSIEQRDGNLEVIPKQGKEGKEFFAVWGLTRSLVFNMVKGVSEGFSKVLEVHGVGYRAQAQGNKLTLNVGYSHPVDFTIPEGADVKVEENRIEVSGIDKQLVGQICANIKKVRKPEPYKGKGIRYQGEHVRRKVGKKVAA